MWHLDFSNTSLSFNRSIWSYHKVRVLRGALTRNRPIFMNLKKPGLVLDIGCGLKARSENLNLDYYWRPGLDICCDITKGLPLPDGYVGGIFTEHCIEHISFKDALAVFGDCLRVMQSGAFIRIIVPDFAIYAHAYEHGQTMPYANADAINGIYSPVMSVNRIFRDHGHQFIYDFDTLSAILGKVGFTEIKQRRFGQSANSRLLLDTPERAIESLYVEARKPLRPGS
jgi:predicted SAM-dependent methyltransferase